MSNQFKTIVLLGGLTAVLVAVGGMLGTTWLYAFTALAVAMNLGAYFYSDRLLLRMHGAKEIGPGELPWLHGIVDELAAKGGLPKPRLFVIDDPQPNAFATGRNPAHGVVAVTRGILELLDRRELRGVIAHELAHIRNRDILVASIAAAIATAVSYIANALTWLPFFGGQDEEGEGGGGGGASMLLLGLVAPFAAMFIQMGISRSREYMADDAGARLSGDPESLARALEKLQAYSERIPGSAQPAAASLYIVNPFGAIGQPVLKLFSTHPPVADRVARLRAMSGGQATWERAA